MKKKLEFQATAKAKGTYNRVEEKKLNEEIKTFEMRVK